jgi:hypothetical protein
MKDYMKHSGRIILILVAITAGSTPAWAATNRAQNVAGGISLTDSTDVTVNSTALALVKAVYSNTTCLVSTDNDAACGGATDTVSVPAGTTLRFVIYVANTTGLQASDVRFQDAITDAGGDYFEFQPNAYGAGTGIRTATLASGTPTKADIITALNGGTPLTNIVSGADSAGIDTTVSPDLLTVGQAGNAAVNIPATNTFAIEFTVIKR